MIFLPRTFALAFAFVVFASASAAPLTDEQVSACLQLYRSSPVAAVGDAGNFLSEAHDDFDYASIDAVSAYIRSSQGLRPWVREAWLDPMNYAVCNVAQASMDVFCRGETWTLERVKAFLLIEGLPAYFAKNPDEARDAYWKP